MRLIAWFSDLVCVSIVGCCLGFALLFVSYCFAVIVFSVLPLLNGYFLIVVCNFSCYVLYC